MPDKEERTTPEVAAIAARIICLLAEHAQKLTPLSQEGFWEDIMEWITGLETEAENKVLAAAQAAVSPLINGIPDEATRVNVLCEVAWSLDDDSPAADAEKSERAA